MQVSSTSLTTLLKLTFRQQKISEDDKVTELALEREGGAKCRDALCCMDHQAVVLRDVVIRHQSKDVVEVRTHVTGVKVHDGGPVGLCWIGVIVHKNNDHNVVANMTLPLQLQKQGVQ